MACESMDEYVFQIDMILDNLTIHVKISVYLFLIFIFSICKIKNQTISIHTFVDYMYIHLYMEHALSFD